MENIEPKDITPKKVVKTSVPEVKQNEVIAEGGGPVPPPPDVPFEYQWLKLRNFFQIPEWDMPRVEDKLQEVFAYAVQEVKSQDFNNIEAYLRSLRLKLGYPTGGNSTLDKIWQYVRLSKDISELEFKRDIL